MSASLVGSEMCIRDSPGTCGQLRAKPETAINCPKAPGSARKRPKVLQAPVSYTHLTLPTICSV
eukprot:1526942-Alexandrium_andersonii.AAC.1